MPNVPCVVIISIELLNNAATNELHLSDYEYVWRLVEYRLILRVNFDSIFFRVNSFSLNSCYLTMEIYLELHHVQNLLG